MRLALSTSVADIQMLPEFHSYKAGLISISVQF